MSDKLEMLLNKIGVNEDYIEYFQDGFVEKVVIDKKSNSFNFIVNVHNIPHIYVYDNFLEFLQKEFNASVSLEFNYDGNDFSNVCEYLNRIIDKYAEDSIRYNVFKGRQIDLNENIIIFKVFNKIEEININNISNDIVKKLRIYGFRNIILKTELEHKEDDILKKIEADK